MRGKAEGTRINNTGMTVLRLASEAMSSETSTVQVVRVPSKRLKVVSLCRSLAAQNTSALY